MGPFAFHGRSACRKKEGARDDKTARDPCREDLHVQYNAYTVPRAASVGCRTYLFGVTSPREIVYSADYHPSRWMTTYIFTVFQTSMESAEVTLSSGTTALTTTIPGSRA